MTQAIQIWPRHLLQYQFYVVKTNQRMHASRDGIENWLKISTKRSCAIPNIVYARHKPGSLTATFGGAAIF